jgi:hypothetical protein
MAVPAITTLKRDVFRFSIALLLLSQHKNKTPTAGGGNIFRPKKQEAGACCLSQPACLLF